MNTKKKLLNDLTFLFFNNKLINRNSIRKEIKKYLVPTYIGFTFEIA